MVYYGYMTPEKLSRRYKGISNIWKCEQLEGTFYHALEICKKNFKKMISVCTEDFRHSSEARTFPYETDKG